MLCPRTCILIRPLSSSPLHPRHGTPWTTTPTMTIGHGKMTLGKHIQKIPGLAMQRMNGGKKMIPGRLRHQNGTPLRSMSSMTTSMRQSKLLKPLRPTMRTRTTTSRRVAVMSVAVDGTWPHSVPSETKEKAAMEEENPPGGQKAKARAKERRARAKASHSRAKASSKVATRATSMTSTTAPNEANLNKDFL